jgi:hypothetical protein
MKMMKMKKKRTMQTVKKKKIQTTKMAIQLERKGKSKRHRSLKKQKKLLKVECITEWREITI